MKYVADRGYTDLKLNRHVEKGAVLEEEYKKENIELTEERKDYLVNELDLPWYNTIFDRIVDTTRWSIIHEIVFEDNGKFYMTTYSEGATECQDERPWEYDYEIKCTEVELKEVKVKKWIPVED